MIIGGYSLISITANPNIPINAVDMNVLITYLISNHELMNGEYQFSLCLPGIADDGYLIFFSYSVHPDVVILFAGARKEDCDDFPEKIKAIVKYLEEYKFVPQILQSIKENSIVKPSILPSICFFYY